MRSSDEFKFASYIIWHVCQNENVSHLKIFWKGPEKFKAARLGRLCNIQDYLQLQNSKIFLLIYMFEKIGGELEYRLDFHRSLVSGLPSPIRTRLEI